MISVLFYLGYKMWKHIAKALQARSQAIRMAINRYNAAAQALKPPCPGLEWNEVIKYGFLAKFDLLQDTRQDICIRPWATPAGQLALDLHFKLQHAQEIKCVNIKIQWLATFI